jgi:ATPase subunit of ABC transporter with duplicated ATPase domains
MYLDSQKISIFCTLQKLYKRKYMLTVNNLSVQFGKRILFDEVNTTFTHGNIYGVIEPMELGNLHSFKIISGEMDPTSGHVHLETGKRMSVLSQNHNMFDEHTVLETVIMGTKHYIPSKRKWTSSI